MSRISAQRQGERSPDYEVLACGVRVIVEVKELQANDDDFRLAADMQNSRTTGFSHQPGKRVSLHIKDAAEQLRRFKTQDMPCVVVMFDNIVVDGFRPHPPSRFLWPYEIDVGMYGFQTANLRLFANGRKPQSLGDGRGRRRRLRPQEKEYISAVSVIYEVPTDGRLFLATYHNYFARTRLPFTVFSGEQDVHFRKPDHPDVSPGSWVRVGSSDEATTT